MSNAILIVEDNPDVLRLIALILKRAGYNVLTATNGNDAINIASRYLPDLILMDLVLPVMDGLRATAHLKSDQYTAAIPIIALSAQSSLQSAEFAQNVGCDGFLTKPFEIEDLLSRIAALTQRRRAFGAC